jgi:hypothetical protein
MAPPSADWQRLLNVRPNDVAIENDAGEEENEELGELYANVFQLGQQFTKVKNFPYKSKKKKFLFSFFEHKKRTFWINY